MIRTPADQGVVHLIDDRFTRRQVRELLPGWWPVATRTRGRPPPQRVQEEDPA